MPSHRLLAEIASREAAQHFAGNAQKAGPAIEKYLSTLRDALNANAETSKYSDTAVGFDWCGAFVYYCCLEAGFHFPPKPDPSYRYTLGAVPAWRHWAVRGGFFHPSYSSTPEPGDIALYNRACSDQPLDHIGIVLQASDEGILSAEGNLSNRTGIVLRNLSQVDGYARLPESLNPPASLL